MTLDEIGLRAGTDKASKGHNYLHFYDRYLSHLRYEPITLVEAGIGGYEFPDRGGESLRMWRKYFEHDHASIVGFDVYEKKLNIPGTRIHQISQDDEAKLNFIIGAYGPIDVFIDDASHINPLSIRTFELMFPKVKPGGVYIWEDIHTSYWYENYKGWPDPAAPLYGKETAATFLHRLQDGLQVDTLENEYREQWDGHIEEMHFMRNTCVIIKRKQ